jgi:hypothetical protein
MTTYNLQVTFGLETCVSCGTVFAVPADFQRQKQENGGNFFCPNGHSQGYKTPVIPSLKKEVENLKSQLESAKRQVTNRDFTIESVLRDKDRLARKLKKLQPVKTKKAKGKEAEK